MFSKQKKANVWVMAFIVGTLAVILLAYLFVPMVKRSTTAQEYQESLTATAVNGTDTVTYTDMVASSLTLGNLTGTDANYSINYTTGVVTFTENITAGSYTATYNYYDPTYLSDTTERTLFAVAVIGAIAGLFFVMMKMFGLV